MVTYGGTAFHRLWQDINNNSCNILLLTPLCSRVQRDNCELRVGRCYVWCGVAMCGGVVWEPTWLWSQQRRRALEL